MKLFYLNCFVTGSYNIFIFLTVYNFCLYKLCLYIYIHLIVAQYLQNEIENLKQTIADMEEKVQYQSDERLQDVNDVLENCQTRVSFKNDLTLIEYIFIFIFSIFLFH